ncbi:MAG: glycosyltransferase family 4 protein, partial [Bacteroidetes bacterium]|nr:glycosyltransferase family 4 protein [Bacteroidota bacterium]
MKVLFVLELYYPNIGGIEKLFKSLAESLVKKGHEVTVVTTRFNKQLQKQELLNGVKIHRLNIKNRFIFSFLGFFFILRFAKQADIIHTTSYNAAFPAWMAAKTCRKRIIITFHEVWGSLWFKLPFLNYCKRVLYYLYEQFILKLLYDHIVAVSDYTRHRLIARGVKENRTSRIYNGLDYTCYKHGKPEPDNSFVFTYFGRLGNSKGLDILLEASSVFVQKHDDAQLKLIIPRVPKVFFK